MEEQIYSSGHPSGFQYENNAMIGINETNDGSRKGKEDEDLIYEENTVYEIDRECYERLKRQRKRKAQDNKHL